ncbi:MAG: pre-peptidase C-terminal domain-containing protein [Planctomycetaceae bacterium]
MNPRRKVRGGILLLAIALLAPAMAQAAVEPVPSSPALTVIVPRGVTRGTETTMTFVGARLKDAEEILFYEPGLKVLELKAENNKVTCKVAVAADCPLGEHTAQVRTRSGISEYRTFFVGPFGAVTEKEPNSDFATPQVLGAVSKNMTVNGVVQNEDVDYYLIEAKKGERISVEVEGMRFGQTLFDPYVGILDMKRFEIAVADDTPLVRQDAATSVIAPADGKYIIEVRDSAYGGNGNCRYRLHVGSFPRPLAVYPPGGKAGEEIEVTYIGDAKGVFTQKIKVPDKPIADYQLFPQDESGIVPSGIPFRIFEHGNVFEKEPNANSKQATPGTLPMAFNGVIQEPGDYDWFKFPAKKGQVYEVECFGRRIRSALDPVMHIFHPNGKTLAGNDDSRGPDSYLRFTCPADGDYFVRVYDHLKRGGPEFTYRIEFSPIKPSLSLGIPRVARYSQSRQQIYVPRGNRFATLISASRANFGGELVLDGKDLPPGIKMIAEPMAANMNTMPVVFEAAADAPIGGKLVNFTAKLNDPKKNISGQFKNRADFVIAQPGQSLYAWKDVSQLAFAVVDDLPFKLEIVQPKVPIVRGGSMNLKIVAHKKEGWDEQIRIQFPFRPPGIGATYQVTMPKGKNEVLYPINANGGAQIKKWPCYCIGYANVGGNAWVASQLAHLEISEPFVNVKLARTAVELGQETEMVATIEVKKEFPGKAKVELLGLPHKVVGETKEIDKAAKEIVFKVKTDKASPAGAHKNVFCRVTLMDQNEPIIHSRLGVTELRIDKPLPPKKNAPKPKPAPKKVVAKKAPEKKPEKRLTRLEKLRLEAKKRREEGSQ